MHAVSAVEQPTESQYLIIVLSLLFLHGSTGHKRSQGGGLLASFPGSWKEGQGESLVRTVCACANNPSIPGLPYTNCTLSMPRRCCDVIPKLLALLFSSRCTTRVLD